MNTFKHYGLRLFAFLFLFPLVSQAADFYWVGGSGNWSDYANHWATSSGGNTFHASIPTLNDNVIVDNLSFSASGQTVLLDSTFYYCKSMTWAGVQFAPQLEGNGATLYIYGSLTLDAAMAIDRTEIVLRSALAGNTVTTTNHVLENITFDGPGQYILGDDLNCLQDLRIQSGCSLDANGHTITCRSILSDTGTSLTTGDISINLDGRWNDVMTTRKVELKGTVLNTNSTNLFFHCNVGLVSGFPATLSVDSITFTNTGSIQYAQANYVYIPGTSNVTNCVIGHGDFALAEVYLTACTFDTLEGKSFVFNGDTTTITVNNRFNMRSDCNDLGSMYSFNSPGGYGVLNVPSGNVTVDWASMSGIHTRGAATFTATNIVDNGNNTGWNMSVLSSRDLYWIGGSGNWNDPNHWSLTSGGGSAGCKPTQLDNVFFDANSFTGDDTINTNEYDFEVNSVSFSGLTSTPRLVGTLLTVHGSILLDAQLQWQVMSLRLKGAFPGQTITCNGIALNFVDVISGADYELQDNLFCEEFYLETGGINLNGNQLDANIVNVYAGTTLDALNATISCRELTLNGTVGGSISTSVIFNRPASALITPGTFYSVVFQENGVIAADLTTHYLTAASDLDINDTINVTVAEFQKNVQLKSSCVIDSLLLNNGGYNLTLDPGIFLNINTTMVSNGDCNNRAGIRSSVYGQQANISPGGGPITIDFLQISSMNVTPAAITANNSIDAGNNTGWTINSPAARTLYWIGSSGNWSDATHWSLSSGGTATTCVPSAVDNVVVDSNSGLSSGTLTIDLSNAAVHDIDFSSAGTAVTIAGDQLQVFGSLSLASGMDWQLTTLTLTPQSGISQVTSAGNRFFNVVVNGNGTVSLTDEWYGKTLDIQDGTFDVNGQDLSISDITSVPGTSFISGAVTITVTNFYLQGTVSNTNSTDVICRQFPAPYNVNNLYLFRTSGTFRDITVMEDGLSFLNTDVNCRVLTAYGDLHYSGYNSIDTIRKIIAFGNLTFQYAYADTLFLNNPGKTVNLAYTVTIGSEFVANGTPAFPILINGGAFMNLVKTSGQVCISDVLLNNVPASGGAQFYAGQGCVDLGGNTGWQFSPCTVVSDVWPGDANYDLNCDNLDILNIGIAFGETGPVRSSASVNWIAQPANDFGNWFSTAVNMKHADCDGNGIIDYDDTLAVSQNYSLNHPARFADMPNHIDSQLPPLVLTASPDTVAPSATVFVDVRLGTAVLPVDSLYGIAFSVHYDPALMDATTLHADFAGSWLGSIGTDMIGFVRNNPVEGRVDFALCRTDHQNIYGGFGHLVLFDVVVVDNISTVSNTLFSISNVTALTYSQFNLAIGRMNDTITIDPLTGIHQPLVSGTGIFIFPNPAKDQVTVLTPGKILTAVQLYDMQGRIVLTELPRMDEISLNLSDLSSGIYEIRCLSKEGEYHSRLQVSGR